MNGGSWICSRLGSNYIYNEHRGNPAIDRVLEVVRAKSPGDHALIAAIERHRADERKHYRMFRRWFELRGAMPFAVDSTCGHIDRFVGLLFRSTIDGLDTNQLIASDALFARLCRVIALTQRRGLWQVESLLRDSRIRRDPVLTKIFQIIHRDEPSHWTPYEGWLAQHCGENPSWRERMIDRFIHAELIFLKLPVLFLSPRLSRRAIWADADEAVPAAH